MESTLPATLDGVDKPPCVLTDSGDGSAAVPAYFRLYGVADPLNTWKEASSPEAVSEHVLLRHTFSVIGRAVPFVIGRGNLPLHEDDIIWEAPGGATLLINSKLVSRLHAQIEFDGEMSTFVLNVLSKNGAVVDGLSCPVGLTKLRSGSRVRIGPACFVFLLPRDAQAALDEEYSAKLAARRCLAAPPLPVAATTDGAAAGAVASTPSQSAPSKKAGTLPPGRVWSDIVVAKLLPDSGGYFCIVHAAREARRAFPELELKEENVSANLRRHLSAGHGGAHLATQLVDTAPPADVVAALEARFGPVHAKSQWWRLAER